MAGLSVPEAYAQAAWMALNTGRIMVLIECREPTEGDWNSCVKETAPEVLRLIVTPMPENTT
jgi:hypothetical protein